MNIKFISLSANLLDYIIDKRLIISALSLFIAFYILRRLAYGNFNDYL